MPTRLVRMETPNPNGPHRRAMAHYIGTITPAGVPFFMSAWFPGFPSVTRGYERPPLPGLDRPLPQFGASSHTRRPCPAAGGGLAGPGGLYRPHTIPPKVCAAKRRVHALRAVAWHGHLARGLQGQDGPTTHGRDGHATLKARRAGRSRRGTSPAHHPTQGVCSQVAAAQPTNYRLPRSQTQGSAE